MTGLTAIGLFLIPLGHHPRSSLTFSCWSSFCSSRASLGQWQAGRVHHLLWPLLIYITVCLVGALVQVLLKASYRRAALGSSHWNVLLSFITGSRNSRPFETLLWVAFRWPGWGCRGFRTVFLKLTPLTGLLGITIKQQSIPHPSLVDHLAGSGLLYDRIPFALICAMLGIFVFGLALQDFRQRLWKMLFLLLALLFFTGPILAGSRMAILLAFFGAISISGLAIGSKQKKGIGLALAAIVFILFAGTWAMSWLTSTT